MLTFFRLSSALAIVVIASSFNGPKELSTVLKAKVSFLPPTNRNGYPQLQHFCNSAL